jgi:adenylate cyclase
MPSDYYIDFAGTPPMVQTVSYYQALDPQRYLPAGTFLDKLVIIGVNTASSVMPGSRTPDHYPTPFTRWGGGYMPGSFIHANIVANLLYGAPIAFTPRPVMALVGLLLAAVYWRFTTTRDLPLRSAVLAILLFLLGTAAFLAFAQLHRYVSPLGLLLPMLTIYLQSPYYDYLQASRQRAFIRGALSSYVSPQVVALIDRDPDVLRLGGTRVEGSVLFLDIAGFTTLTERHSPELIVQFINEYLSELVDIAMNAGGTVERFLGDAVMVVWGAPLAQADHARRACDAALTMVDRIRAMSAAAEQRLGAPVSARIGVNSGTMIAGNIGGNRRFNYTVMGDAVNLAARLEAANKSYRTTILIGDATRELIGEDYLCRLVDRVRVKGRAQVSALWELVGRAQAVDSDLRYALATYAVALDQYRAGNFAEAIEGFARVADLRPDDGPAAALRSRCERLLRHPPAERWDGVVDLEK